MRTLVVALAVTGLAACSRTLVGGGVSPLEEERFACVDVDLGSSPSAQRNDTTATARNVLTGSCGGEDAPERVYRWEVPATGVYRITTDGSELDTILYVINGGCSGVELACNDDTVGTASQIDVDAEAGAELVIVVDGYGGEAGSYQLRITPL